MATALIMPPLERIEAPVTFKAYLMCAFAAFAGILFGYDSGYISSVLAMNEFKRQYGHPVPSSEDPSGFDYATWQKSLIVSILSAGTFGGALISGWLADQIGRRPTIIGPGCGVFLAGVAIQVAATNVAALTVGRFIAGLGVGCVSAINILYMSEVAPRKVRGAIVSCYQFAITIGIMLASCVGYATSELKNTGAFRIPIALQVIWALILGTGLFLLPESPRYWVKKNRLDKAAFALARVRGQPWNADCVEDELAEMVANHEFEVHVGEVSWFGCFSGGIMNPNSNARKVFIGTMLQMFQQWTGINFIIYYNTTFFQEINITNPFLISICTVAVNVVGTPVSFWAIERFGRRPLLIWGAVGMSICELMVAIVGITMEKSQVAVYVLIVFVCIYTFIFAATWGPAAWVVVGEIFQLQIRSKGIALSTASNWFWNCVIAVITPYMVDKQNGNLGVKVFFVWGSTCVLCALFAWAFVPESKGLTLEQVDRMMDEVAPHRSSTWKPTDTFAYDFNLTSPVGTVSSKQPMVTTTAISSSSGTDSRKQSTIVGSPVSTMEGKQPTIEYFIDR